MPGDTGHQRVVAQPGSALAWGARGRWFESSPPDFYYFSPKGLQRKDRQMTCLF